MRNLVVSILIPFILLFNCNSAFSFDFAPEVGDYAPNFQLEGFNKNIKTKTTWELSDFQGKWLVIYFYPKDFTAGCTLEAKGFSELKKRKYDINILTTKFLIKFRILINQPHLIWRIYLDLLFV